MPMEHPRCTTGCALSRGHDQSAGDRPEHSGTLRWSTHHAANCSNACGKIRHSGSAEDYGRRVQFSGSAMAETNRGLPMIPNPLALIAELTHRCPLHCVYCSNPLQLVATKAELSTEEWIRVFQEASRLGVLHLHLTGGEPAARTDLKELIAAAREAGLYTNLITSGLGISESRLAELMQAGLDHIQLSFQDSRDEPAQWISGTKAHAYKVALAEKIRRLPVAFTVNLVVHRQNLDHIEEMIAFIEQLQPERIEIAHAQYYGWALKNRDALLPTPQQLESCSRSVEQAQLRLAGKVRIDSVVPDYYARYPKACMGGWGRRLMLIDPSGQGLPCHAAGVIPG